MNHDRTDTCRDVTSESPDRSHSNGSDNANMAKCKDAATHICVQLSDKAGEIVVLEVFWQKVPHKLRILPDGEATEKQTVNGRKRNHTTNRITNPDSWSPTKTSGEG